MGTDIHSFAEVRRNDKWIEIQEKIFSPNDSWGQTSEPFGWRSYGMFGFLADVRNYSEVPPIVKRRGLPTDSEKLEQPVDSSDPESVKYWEAVFENEYHSFGFITLRELLEFDYDQTFVDKRADNMTVTYREFLATGFFAEIEVLKTLGAPDDVRVIFWFDN